MANRNFTQFSYSFEKYKVDLFGKISFGAAGAPTLAAFPDNRGIKSITRVSAGKYTITLQDSYYSLLMVKHAFQNATAPASPSMYIFDNSVTSATAPSITVIFNSAGTATDPGSGEVVYLDITLRNSNAP